MERYKNHLKRHNIDVYKLSSLCQHLDILYSCRGNDKQEVLWEMLNQRMKSYVEAHNEKPVIYDTVKRAWEQGKFTKATVYGFEMENHSELFGETNAVEVLAKIAVIEIVNMCRQIYSGRMEYIRSKKVLLRMIKNIINTDFNDRYENWEWFYFQHVKPILGELVKLHYRRDTYFYY